MIFCCFDGFYQTQSMHIHNKQFHDAIYSYTCISLYGKFQHKLIN